MRRFNGWATNAGQAQAGRVMRPSAPQRLLAALALLAILSLLLAFVQVAKLSVHQGEMRRVAMAARTDATWRCNATTDSRERERCQRRLDATPIGVIVATDDSNSEEP